MNKREMIQEVIDHLTALGWREREPQQHSFGVCCELANNLPFNIHLDMWSFNQQWKHYSYNSDYPIQGDPSHCCGDPYESYGDPDIDNWSDTKYGNYRRQYCLDMAEWLEDNIEEICQ